MCIYATALHRASWTQCGLLGSSQKSHFISCVSEQMPPSLLKMGCRELFHMKDFNLAVVAEMVRWFLLCRRHRGAYSNTWCPWQQNNIRRSWSDELALPKTKRWMAGWKLRRSTKDLIHTQQKSRPLSEAEASASPLLYRWPSPGNQKCEFIPRFHSRQERRLDH